MDALDAAVRLLVEEVLGPGLSPDVGDLLTGRLADAMRATMPRAATEGGELVSAIALLADVLDAQAVESESHSPPQSIEAVAITILGREAMRLYAQWQRARAVQYEDLLGVDWGDVWDDLAPAPALVLPDGSVRVDA